MATAAGRLKRALDAKGKSVYWLYKSLKRQTDESGTPLRGAGSYSSVHAYVNGVTQPSNEILLAAAPLLGVRPEWLASERGAMTEEEELAAQAGNTTPSGAQLFEQMGALLAAGCPAIESAGGFAKHAAIDLCLVMVQQRLDDAGDPPWPYPLKALESVAEQVGTWLRQTLELFIGPRIPPGRELDDAVVALCAAARTLVRPELPRRYLSHALFKE